MTETTPPGTDTQPDNKLPSHVKAPLTRRRPRRDVETMDYLGAARRFIRAAGRRVGDCDEHELAALLDLQNSLDVAIQTAVDGQRSYGKSWADIARATGATREAAYMRWGAK